MPEGGRRRTPGLRREEVAVLAGVGVSWYTWLEQGRDIKVSAEVLDAIARALLLDGVERASLYRLAGLNPPEPHGPPSAAAPPPVRRLLDAWSPLPGYIRDRYWNFTEINEGARRVFGYGESDRNCLVSFFTNTRYRALHRHWVDTAPVVVAGFRADAARYPDDPEFDRIAAELARLSPEFAELWARRDVAEHTSAVKTIDHPDVGVLVFDATLLPLPTMPGHHLVLHCPRPGTETERRLERLFGGRCLVASHPG